MKIALCSLSDREEIREISWPLMEQYCKIHGYDFVTRTEILLQDRHPSWSKLPFLKSLLSSYDITIWFDDDIVLTQPDVRIESLIEPFLGSDQVIAVSANSNAPFNFGLIVCKPNAGPCLDKISQAMTEETRYGLLWEETASKDLYVSDPVFKEQVYIVPRRILQGFHRACSHEDYIWSWKEKTFSMHVAGFPKDTRIEYMRQTVEILDLKSRFGLHG